MQIKVNEQTQRFYLAYKEWRPAVGHEIKVGKYRFCAIPHSEGINVSEVTSGTKIITLPFSPEIMMVTASKEDTLKFLQKVGKQLEQIIKKTKNFDDIVKSTKKTTFERLGEMPPIEDVDTDWVFAKQSDLVN